MSRADFYFPNRGKCQAPNPCDGNGGDVCKCGWMSYFKKYAEWSPHAKDENTRRAYDHEHQELAPR